VCEETNNSVPEHTTNTFYPNKMYKLKDGNVGILEINEQEMISKLYENLNNDNKERMVKLLSESRDSFNRVLKLARLEESKRTKQ
jgi:abortive infection bacteriophage resistance protein